MRWNVIFAAILTVGFCNCGYGFEFLNRMLGTSHHYGGCSDGCCGEPSCAPGCHCDDALSAKYGAPPPCPCDCCPKPRAYSCIKICIPKITLPCPKIFCSVECYKPTEVSCGCGYHYGSKCWNGYTYGGHSHGGYSHGYGDYGAPAAEPIPEAIDALPEPIEPPIAEPSAYHAPRRMSRSPESLWNW
jgi:hypothetical protein